jgi:hypothetical protein
MIATQAADTSINFLFPVRQIGIHQAFKQFSVVRHTQMKKLVYDHHLPKRRILPEQIFAEADPPGC